MYEHLEIGKEYRVLYLNSSYDRAVLIGKFKGYHDWHDEGDFIVLVHDDVTYEISVSRIINIKG